MSLLTYLEFILGGYVALTVLLYALSPMVSKAGFAARCLASYVSMLIAAAYGVFASVLLGLVGLRGIAQWTTGRVFKYAMLATTGVTFEVVDPRGHLASTRPAVFVGNHQTELDVLMLGCIFPRYCSVTAKASLKKVPVLGWFMTLSGSVFIDRKNTKDAREAMQGAADQMSKRRQSVYMFPEGTRSYAKEPMLLPFKKGAFHLAVHAQVPIVPVVAANYSDVLDTKNYVFKSGKIPCKGRVFIFRSFYYCFAFSLPGAGGGRLGTHVQRPVLTIDALASVLEPIPTTGKTAADVDELCAKTREIMLKEIINLTYEARGQEVPIPASTVKASGVELKQ